LIAGNSQETTSVFKEFFRTYHATIEAESQYKIAALLHREGEYDLASRTLEMLAEHPDTLEPLREKSMFLAAKLLDKLALHEAAQGYYERFTKCYPLSIHIWNQRCPIRLLLNVKSSPSSALSGTFSRWEKEYIHPLSQWERVAEGRVRD
jgi:hypothetical protein